MPTRLTLLITLISSLWLQAQPPAYPKNYFRVPLDIPMELSANFGELRPNHWHMGLDIRTNQKENLPVYAAAQGYIASIGIRPQSFGRFIVINHPNGLSTLYAHLNDFYPELETYVTNEQYKQESWGVELSFRPDQFPVSKGQFIAYSGNTGGSQGPHLHFEIFDTKTTRRYNPLLFGFPIKDEVPPNITRLAMYDRRKPLQEQSPVMFNLKLTDSGYVIPKNEIIRTGINRLSFAIQAYDRQSGSSNPNGIYSAKTYVDEQPFSMFVLDSIDYDQTVYMNAQIDYKLRANGGAFLQHLAALPGDHGVAYKKFGNDGILSLNDTNVHLISVDVKDTYGNTAALNFRVQYFDSLAKEIVPGVSEKISPNSPFNFRKPDFEVTIPAGAVYDSVRTMYYRNTNVNGYAVSAAHQFNDATIPVHSDIKVRIKASREIPEEWRDHLVMQRSGRGNTIRKVVLENGWFTADFSDFGTFQVFADMTPPSVNELGKADTVNLSGASRIIFTPSDNFGMVKKFRAELDGAWLRFTNDKSRSWIYKFDERCPFGVHELKVRVEDFAGNITTRSWWFRREAYTPPPPKKATKKKGKTTTTSSKKKVTPKKKKK